MKGIYATRNGRIAKPGERPDAWSVRWREGTKNRRRTFNRADGFKEKDAENFLLETRRRKRLGGIELGASEMRFEDFVENVWWTPHSANLKPATEESYRRMLDKYLLPVFGNARLCDISVEAVEEFRAAMTERKVGEPTQAKVLTVLSAVFSKALRSRRVSANPVILAEGKPVAYRQRIVQPFPPERVEGIRAAFLSEGRIEDAAFVSALAYSGPRPGEAMALTWADVDKKQIIYNASKVRGVGTKQRATRLLAPLADDLEAWHKESGVLVGRVFDWSPTKYHNWRRRHFQRVTDLSRPYDLRHAFVTLLLGEGRELTYVARQLGDLVSTMERWYVHLAHLGDTQLDASEAILRARRSQPASYDQRAL